MTEREAGAADDDRDRELRALVEETRGARPWRRFLHAAGGIVLVVVVETGTFDRPELLGVLVGLLALLVTLDVVRLRDPRLNVLFFRSFRSLVSPREARGPASSTWYVAGGLLSLLLFGTDAAVAGILVLALADPAASVVGRRWGRVPVGRGTVEGSATFLVVAALAASAVVSVPAAVRAAVGGALVEPLPWPLDDNLTVPVAAAGAAALPALL